MAGDEGRSYRIVELVGTSPDGIEAAIDNGIKAAGEAVDSLDWFQVREIRGRIENKGVAWYQVTLGVGFRVDDASQVI
ncbi:MAG: dodecin family protein [Dehalococcoidia bacterium]|nr:dodecin family protein [Dehalococcoidia bacterium]HRC62304.1 dodecin family protein [Dehalococcoidia bacterium]